MNKKQPKTSEEHIHRTRYPKEVQTECVSLLKQGLSIAQVVEKVNGPKERAVERYAKKSGIML